MNCRGFQELSEDVHDCPFSQLWCFLEDFHIVLLSLFWCFCSLCLWQSNLSQWIGKTSHPANIIGELVITTPLACLVLLASFLSNTSNYFHNSNKSYVQTWHKWCFRYSALIGYGILNFKQICHLVCIFYTVCKFTSRWNSWGLHNIPMCTMDKQYR